MKTIPMIPDHKKGLGTYEKDGSREKPVPIKKLKKIIKERK